MGGLEDLPPELFDGIVAYCGTDTLRMLRLTSRGICNALGDTFLSKFFTKRAHLCTLDSLRALAGITASRTLTSRLREIEIVFLKPANSFYLEDLQVLVSPPERVGYQDLAFQEALKEVARIMDNDCGTDLLAGAFADLKNLGVEAALSLSDQLGKAKFGEASEQGVHPPVYGLATLSAAIARHRTISAQHLTSGYSIDTAADVKMLLLAIANAEYPLSALNLFTDAVDPREDPGSYRISMTAETLQLGSSPHPCLSLAEQLAPSCRSLKNLEIAYTKQPRDSWDLNTIPRMQECLSVLSTALESLSFRASSYLDGMPELAGRAFSNFVCGLNCMNLTSLRVQHSMCCIEDLQRLFALSSTSLRSLKLEGITLLVKEGNGRRNDWRTVLRSVAESMNLDSIKLQDLRETDLEHQELQARDNDSNRCWQIQL